MKITEYGESLKSLQADKDGPQGSLYPTYREEMVIERMIRAIEGHQAQRRGAAQKEPPSPRSKKAK